MSDFRDLVPLPVPDLDPAAADFLPALLGSPEFETARQYFADYPSRSLLIAGDRGRAFLYLLTRLRRATSVLEIGTYRAGTTEVFARALWANGKGEIATVDPSGPQEIESALATWAAPLQAICHPFVGNSMAFFSRAKLSGWSYDVVFVDGDHDLQPASFDIWSAAAVLNPNGFIVIDNTDQPGPRDAARRFLRDHSAWRLLGPGDRDLAVESSLIRIEDDGASVPGTSMWVLQAPAAICVGESLAVFPMQTIHAAILHGFSIALVPGMRVPRGTLRYKTYLRGILIGYWDDSGMVEVEAVGAVATKPDWGAGRPVEIVLPQPMADVADLRHPERYWRTFECFLIFEAEPDEECRIVQLQRRPQPLLDPPQPA